MPLSTPIFQVALDNMDTPGQSFALEVRMAAKKTTTKKTARKTKVVKAGAPRVAKAKKTAKRRAKKT